MIYLTWFIVPFAAWNLSRMMRKSSGPLNVFSDLRRLVGVETGICYQEGGIKEWLSCNKCLGWWASFILQFFWFLAISIETREQVQFFSMMWLPLVFASSTITILLETIDERWSLPCEETTPPPALDIQEKSATGSSGGVDGFPFG